MAESPGSTVISISAALGRSISAASITQVSPTYEGSVDSRAAARADAGFGEPTGLLLFFGAAVGSAFHDNAPSPDAGERHRHRQYGDDDDRGDPATGEAVRERRWFRTASFVEDPFIATECDAQFGRRRQSRAVAVGVVFGDPDKLDLLAGGGRGGRDRCLKLARDAVSGGEFACARLNVARSLGVSSRR